MAVALALLSMFAGTAAVPYATADGLKHKKHTVAKHIHSVHQNIDESSSRLRHAAAALDQARASLHVARGHLHTARAAVSAAKLVDDQMQAKLDAAVQRLAGAQQDLATGRAKIAQQKKLLGQIVVENYQTGGPGLMGLSMVLTSQDPTQLTGNLNSVQNVMDKETATLSRLQAGEVLLIVQERAVAQAKAEVARQRKVAAQHLARRRTLEQAAADAKATVVTLVAHRADAKRHAARARRSDLRELHRLHRESNRISRILKRRAARAARRAAHRAAQRAGRAVNTGGFLDWPARGPITSPFGWRIQPIYGYRSFHDGVDIAIPCGTPLHAPAAGRVLQEYYNVAWGNRLIMDLGYHRGVGLAVIFNHMSRYVAHPGQHVRRGQVVGYSGTTGWSTGCHLHFTVMVNGTAANPMNWL
jgi:murein DD-endopeptidase MepM/ murein hydrolase activator NlpD